MLNPLEALWSDNELAQLMRMDVRTIANRYSAGKPMPPFVSLPGTKKRLFVPGAVLDWMGQHQVAAKVHRRRGRPGKQIASKAAEG